MVVFYKMGMAHGKLYVFPSQLTIMRLLSQFHGIKISIATVNRWLKDAVEKGYIIRKPRIRRDEERGMVFQTTMYIITKFGLYKMAMAGHDVWKEIAKLPKNGFKMLQNGFRKAGDAMSFKEVLTRSELFAALKRGPVSE